MNKVMLINEDGFVIGEVELPPSWKKGDKLTAQLSVDGKVVAELDITPNGYHEDSMGDCQHAVFGIPRMLPVIKTLWDVKKVTGPAQEMKFDLKELPLPIVHSDFTLDLKKINEESQRIVDEYFERYRLGLKRYLLLDSPGLKIPDGWLKNPDDDVKPDFEVGGEG